MRPWLALFLLLLALACSNSGGPTELQAPGTLPGSFRQVQVEVLNPFCIRCHRSENLSAGLDFTTYPGTLQTVKPGEADASPLFRAAEVQHMSAQVGEAALTDLRTWIESGAPNN